MVAVSRPAVTWVEGTGVNVRAASSCKLMDAVVDPYALVSLCNIAAMGPLNSKHAWMFRVYVVIHAFI